MSENTEKVSLEDLILGLTQKLDALEKQVSTLIPTTPKEDAVEEGAGVRILRKVLQGKLPKAKLDSLDTMEKLEVAFDVLESAVLPEAPRMTKQDSVDPKIPKEPWLQMKITEGSL